MWRWLNPRPRLSHSKFLCKERLKFNDEKPFLIRKNYQRPLPHIVLVTSPCSAFVNTIKWWNSAIHFIINIIWVVHVCNYNLTYRMKSFSTATVPCWYANSKDYLKLAFKQRITSFQGIAGWQVAWCYCFFFVQTFFATTFFFLTKVSHQCYQTSRQQVRKGVYERRKTRLHSWLPHRPSHSLSWRHAKK